MFETRAAFVLSSPSGDDWPEVAAHSFGLNGRIERHSGLCATPPPRFPSPAACAYLRPGAQMGMLFISHSNQDNDQAIKVRVWIRSNGWGGVFLDIAPANGLAQGQVWQDGLKRAGANCAAVVTLVSPTGLGSRGG